MTEVQDRLLDLARDLDPNLEARQEAMAKRGRNLLCGMVAFSAVSFVFTVAVIAIALKWVIG